MAWSLCSALNDKYLPILGFQIPSNNLLSSHQSESIIQEYLPVTSNPPEYPVCKEYLEFLFDVIEDLKIPFIMFTQMRCYMRSCMIFYGAQGILLQRYTFNGRISSTPCDAEAVA